MKTNFLNYSKIFCIHLGFGYHLTNFQLVTILHQTAFKYKSMKYTPLCISKPRIAQITRSF